VTMFRGAKGPLNGGGSGCRVTISVGVSAKAIDDDAAAGAASVRLRRSGLDVAVVNRRSGDCSVEALILRLACGIGVVEVADEALRDNGFGPSSAPVPRDCEAVIVGADVLEAVPAEPASDDADDGPLASAGSWSASDAVALVCAPPVLCTTPVGESGVADESADDGLLVAVDVADVVVDADDESDEGLDGLSLSVDEEADDVDEPAVEELDDELESDVSAIAIPGMVATAEPTPSAIANAPTRPTYLT